MAKHNHPSLEHQIARALAPVAAPDELWSRVSATLPPAGPSTSLRTGGRWPRHLAMAGALAAALTAGVIYLRAYEHPPSLVGTAIQLHRSGTTTRDPHYAVQRYPGIPATLVSSDSVPTQPGHRKHVISTEVDDLAISEWTSQGRRWVLVSHKSVRHAACRMCHKA